MESQFRFNKGRALIVEIMPLKQVKHCKIKGELAGRKQTFEGVVYQQIQFIRIKAYTQKQIIND